MRDLLRRFASVPLALAAYNAGPAPWRAACASRRSRRRAATSPRILGLMGGAGELAGGAGFGSEACAVARANVNSLH